MEAKVEIINNPYAQRVRILINGKKTSAYGTLEQYQDEPFWNWCDYIIEEVCLECNVDEIDLIYTGRLEENAVFRKIATRYSGCRYRFRPLETEEDLQQKMKKLNQFLARYKFNVRQKVFRTGFYLSKRHMDLRETLASLDVSNIYCKIMPIVCEMPEFETSASMNDLNFVIDEVTDADYTMQHCGSAFCFIIHVGREDIGFEEKEKRVFQYQCTKGQLFQTIFECLKLIPLLVAFRECVLTISDSALLKQSSVYNQLAQILSIEQPFRIECESMQIEVGKSVSLHVSRGSERFAVNNILFEYENPGVIECTGLRVKGLSPGASRMYLFREGENAPFYTMEFSVIKRNRISEIVLEDGTFFIGEGDRYKLSYHYYPIDADNVEKIRWMTNQNDRLQISDSGVVTALMAGQYKVICTAEQVSASVICVVKPYMKEITVSENEITMVPGETYTLQYSFSPDCCIDDSVIIHSGNLQIVNAVGGTLKAAGCGQTDVTLMNQRGTVRQTVHVTVNPSHVKKKGLLARLFGKNS